MSNYTQSTNFATKDALSSGDPLKIVKGTEINTEFVNISVAIATKADLASPTFSGTPLSTTAAAGTNNTQIATTAFVAAAATAAMQLAYPVGSIYMNAGVSTNPATLLGFGTWTAFGAGRMLVSLNGSDALFDTLEETGGTKDSITVSHTHTFSGTTAGAGAHNHTLPQGNTQNGNGNYIDSAVNLGSYRSATGDVADHAHTYSGTTASTGSSGTNANLPPYITVAMWKRTA
jgi:hypothetical protein